MIDEARFSRLDPQSRELISWRVRWLDTARPKQIEPSGDWDVWANVCGRGWGKTRVGAEWTGYEAASRPNTRWAVVGPTQNDVRSVCFEGESGLLAVIPPSLIKKNGYNRSLLELELTNGSLIVGKSAEKPDRLRGPQFHGAWGDELASWGAVTAGSTQKEGARLKETWDNLRFGLRLGDYPRIVITTTPRPIEFLRQLKKDPRCRMTEGSTFENTTLAATSLRAYREIYEGTRKGRQELYGEILENVEGALWSWAMLEKAHLPDVPDDVTFVRVVIAVDPAVTTEEDSDEWGVVVVALGGDGLVYVLADLSGKLSPRKAAQEILAAYDRFEADCVVGETNQGGDLVEATLRAENPDRFFRFKAVHAKRGKYLRAEPVAAYYEKAKVRHVGRFPTLEKQMCEFVGSTSGGSPDRLDALVYGVGELMLGSVKHDFW